MANEKRLIDANAYKASLTKWKEDAWKHNERHDAMLIADCLCELETMPTVDAVEVVHGQWAIFEDDWNSEVIYECSVCKEAFVTLDGEPMEKLWNYCPNCGAKMDGDGNDRV